MEKKRRRIGFVVLLLLLAAVMAFLAGPRAEVDLTVRPVSLAVDLDAWLSEEESRVPDLLPGTEKTIIWAGAPGQTTPVSVVYLHGFSATRQETAPLADRIARDLGANLFYTRLTGHGSTGEALADASVNDWFNDTAEAFEIGGRIGETVVVIATSTGCPLAVWLAAYLEGRGEGAGLKGLILLSPNFRPKDPGAVILTWPWGRQIAEMVIGPTRSWTPDNPRHERFWTNSYPTRALIPMMALVSHVRAMDLSQVKAPVFMIYSPDDRVISPATALKAFDRFGSPVRKTLAFTRADDVSQHVLAGDILSPNATKELSDAVIDFIRSL